MDVFRSDSRYEELTPVMRYDVMCRDHFHCVFLRKKRF